MSILGENDLQFSNFWQNVPKFQKMFFSLELMKQLLPNLDRSVFSSIEFTTEIKLKFKGHKGQKRPGFRALTALPTNFIFYYEFLHLIVHLIVKEGQCWD